MDTQGLWGISLLSAILLVNGNNAQLFAFGVFQRSSLVWGCSRCMSHVVTSPAQVPRSYLRQNGFIDTRIYQVSWTCLIVAVLNDDGAMQRSGFNEPNAKYSLFCIPSFPQSVGL